MLPTPQRYLSSCTVNFVVVAGVYCIGDTTHQSVLNRLQNMLECKFSVGGLLHGRVCNSLVACFSVKCWTEWHESPCTVGTNMYRINLRIVDVLRHSLLSASSYPR